MVKEQKMFDLVSLGLIIFTALIASLNPCSVGIIILMISTTLGDIGKSARARKKLFWLGSIFILSFMLAGLTFGWLAYLGASLLPTIVLGYFAILVGLVMTIFGILEIKDYFWYGRGLSLQIPSRWSDSLHRQITERKNYLMMLRLGLSAFIGGVFCGGIVYLGVVMILSMSIGLATGWLLMIYNTLVILPMLVILAIVSSGIKISHVSRWKEETKHYLRLYNGLLLIGLSWLILLINGGALTLG